jgi:hypothetical protein
MSAVLRKRIPRREDVLNSQFRAAVFPAVMLILTLTVLLVFLGQFHPAG